MAEVMSSNVLLSPRWGWKQTISGIFVWKLSWSWFLLFSYFLFYFEIVPFCVVWFSLLPVFFRSFPSPVLFPPHSTTCTWSPRWCLYIFFVLPHVSFSLFRLSCVSVVFSSVSPSTRYVSAFFPCGFLYLYFCLFVFCLHVCIWVVTSFNSWWNKMIILNIDLIWPSWREHTSSLMADEGLQKMTLVLWAALVG